MAKVYIDDTKLTAIRNKIFSSFSEAEQVNIFDVINLSSGDYLPTQKMVYGKYAVYGGGGITDNKHSDYNVEFETLGIGRVGARCGCVFKIIPQSWITDNALYANRIDNRFDIEFLIHYLNFKNINQYANTSAQPVISQKRISGILIPKIDLKLQKEIALILNNIEKGLIEFENDKYGIGETLNYISSKEHIDTELTSQLTLVKQLRQAFLKEAMQGKLVPQDPNDEPASKLLKKIKIEKLKIQNGKKEKPLPEIKPEEIPFEIPNNWIWCKLGEISELIYGDGLTKFQRKDNGKYPVYGSNGIVGYYDYYLTDKKAIIIGRKGSAGALNICDTPSWTTDVAYYVEESQHINFQFQFFLLKSLQLENLGKGIKPGLNRNKVYNLPIPLPPFPEQMRIVTKLDELMIYCDELEKQIKESKTNTEKLMQVILQEALKN